MHGQRPPSLSTDRGHMKQVLREAQVPVGAWNRRCSAAPGPCNLNSMSSRDGLRHSTVGVGPDPCMEIVLCTMPANPDWMMSLRKKIRCPELNSMPTSLFLHLRLTSIGPIPALDCCASGRT